MISKKEAVIKDMILNYLKMNQVIDFYNSPNKTTKAQACSIEGDLNMYGSKYGGRLEVNYEDIFVFADDMIREKFLISNKTNQNRINQSYILTSNGLKFIDSGGYQKRRRLEKRQQVRQQFWDSSKGVSKLIVPAIFGGVITLFGRHLILNEPTNSDLQLQIDSLQSKLESLDTGLDDTIISVNPLIPVLLDSQLIDE